MAGEDVKQIDDLEGNLRTDAWQYEVGQHAANQRLKKLEKTREHLFYVGDDVLKLIDKDKGLKKEFATLRAEVVSAKGLISPDLQHRLLFFNMKVMQTISEKDAKAARKNDGNATMREQLAASEEAYTAQLIDELGTLPPTYIYTGWNESGALALFDILLTSDGFPDTIRKKTREDEEHEAEEQQQATAMHEAKNEAAKTTLGDLDKMTNPYLVVAGTPEQLVQKLHEHPENLTADERIKIIQYILVSKHFDKERADFLAVLTTTSFDAQKFGKILWNLKIRLQKAEKRARKDKPKKPKNKEKSFDISDDEPVPFAGNVFELLLPPKVKDAEISKAVLTLPQMQARIALTLTEPYMGYFEVTDVYVADMKAIGLNPANRKVTVSEWRQRFVAPNPASPYAIGYKNLINANNNKLLNPTGAVPKYEAMLLRLNGMGFPGFIEGADPETEQLYSSYVQGIIERTAARYVLLGSKGQLPYDEFIAAVNTSMRPFGKNYTFPTFAEMRNRVIADPTFLDLPRKSTGSNSIREQGEDLTRKAQGDMGIIEQDPEEGFTENDRIHDDDQERQERQEGVYDDGQAVAGETYDQYLETRRQEEHAPGTDTQFESNIPVGMRDERFQGEVPASTPRREDPERGNREDEQQRPPIRQDDRETGEGTFVEGVPEQPRFEEVRPGDEARRDADAENNGEHDHNEHEREDALTYGQRMDILEDGITDFRQIGIDKKIALANEMYLSSPEKYASDLEKPFLEGEYDHVVVVFSNFRRTTDELTRANGHFSNRTEEQALRQMKEEARGKRVGIYYVNTALDSGVPDMPVFLQRRLGIIQGKQKVKMSGVVVFSGKDLSQPSHQRMTNLAVGMNGFRSRVADPDGYRDPAERSAAPAEGQKPGREAVGEEEPEAGTEIQLVPTIAEYTAMREGLADGERALIIRGTTREKISDAKLLQLTSYYAKKGVKVVYIPNADDNTVWKGKFDARIVTKADGSPAMFPESRIPATATKHHKVTLPFALVLQRNGASYDGTGYCTAERGAQRGYYAIAHTVNQLDKALKREGK